MTVATLPERPLQWRGARVAQLRSLGGLARDARRLERTARPRALVAWGARAILAAARPGLEAPVVAVHHDLPARAEVAAAVRLAARRAAALAAPSWAVAGGLAPRGRPVVVLHPGVDLGAWTPAPLPPSSPPRALVLGALVPWKRADLALEIAARMPELQLTLAGAPLPGDPSGFAASLHRRAEAADLRGRVELAGALPDPRPALANAHCLLHCADAEPYGLALVEALAAGRPVVAPAAAGPLEIVGDGAPRHGRLYRTRRRRGGRRGAPRGHRRPRGRAGSPPPCGGAVLRRGLGRPLRRPARGRRAVTAFTAVVVLHDSEPELAALLRSIDRHLQEPPQLVVVDTGSRDDGPALARAHGAEVVELPDNPGFGAANNEGLRRARHDVTVLLNPDTELIDGSLATLAGIARAHPRALHAPRLLELDGRVQRSAHPRPGTAGALLPALVHPALLPRGMRQRAEPHRAGTPRTVGWAIAACLAAATETLRALGPFDPAVHLFAEDMELGLRARRDGIPTVLHPQLRLLHAGGHAVLRGGEPFELLARRRRDAVEAALGRRARTLDDGAQALTFATRIAARTVLGRDARRERAQFAALRAARR